MIDLDTTRKILHGYPELRVSDIPANGLYLKEGYILVCNEEGEIALYPVELCQQYA